ncbi:MAG: peptidase M28, partial [Bacteroidota bacterium]
MKNLLFLLLICFWATTLFAQQPRVVDPAELAENFAATINVEDMRRHLAYLASDAMEGRETGEPGQKRAADYIAKTIKYLGFPAIGEDGGYYQTILFKRQKWATIQLENAGEVQKHLRQFYSIPDQNNSRETIEINELTFLGYGIDDKQHNDYAKAGDLKGKSIIIFAGEPLNNEGKSRITGTTTPSDWSTNTEKKLALAYQRGVETVFIIDPSFRENAGKIRRQILDGRMHMAEQREEDRE